jgi:hypothetical protein
MHRAAPKLLHGQVLKLSIGTHLLFDEERNALGSNCADKLKWNAAQCYEDNYF